MGEQVFNSPGVKAQEIDLSGPKATQAEGTPAGVIGTSRKGRAFVPVTMPNFSQFIAKFGDIESKEPYKFGPLAVRQWFNNGARAGTYVRVLGAGDGLKRVASGKNAGRVNRAGWVVGDAQVQDNGVIGVNKYAGAAPSAVPTAGGYGALGRTYFLGCFMSESNADGQSTYLREAGIIDLSTGNGFETATTITGSKPILRGVLFAASGVSPSLSGGMHQGNDVRSSNSIYIRQTHAYQGFTGSDNSFGQGFNSAVHAGLPDTNAGGWLGDVDKSINGGDKFVLLLNGMPNNEEFNNVLTCSFDPREDAYFPKVLNTDPDNFEKAGHYLYTHYDIDPTFAVVTASYSALSGSDQVNADAGAGGHIKGNLDAGGGAQTAFLVTSSLSRNSGSADPGAIDVVGSSYLGGTIYGCPNYEGFEDRYQAAFSPFVISQDLGDGPVNLFKIHAISDGVGGYDANSATGDLPPERIKISIRNIKKSTSTDPSKKYGSFDLEIRDIKDHDNKKSVFEKWTNLNLDPSSENYVARRIGDTHMYWDWDRAESEQKLVVEGKYPNMSNHIRIEMDSDADEGIQGLDPKALPVGFRGFHHLVTSGSNIFVGATGSLSRVGNTTAGADTVGVTPFALSEMVEPPVPYRRSLSRTRGASTYADTDLYWGVQVTRQTDLDEPNKSQVFNDSILSYTKYFPMNATLFAKAWAGDNAGASDKGGTVLDSDRFNNNMFTLERVQVVTASLANVDLPDALEWAAARYRRDGVLANLTKSNGTWQTGRFLDVEKDFGDSTTQAYLKFSFFLQGGFNGLNIFDKEKSEMSDLACRREFDDATNQGGVNGPTIKAYRRAIDILEEKADADIKLLAIPGLRHQTVTDYAIDSTEDRFDAMYIMDVEEKDSADTFITGSDQIVDVTNTVRRFQDRNLDSSFAAAYFPDVRLRDNASATDIKVPPTVAVLGALSLNDNIGHPWLAPAGFTRGALSDVIDVAVQLNTTNMDTLYQSDINPIATFPTAPNPMVYGQKTLLRAQSALDRVNVRRLLIEIRRRVRAIANRILFEPNQASTLAKFSAAVIPVLNQIQQQQGLDRFKVQIDTSTTTQADIENNTIRGKIFLQPTRSVEFIGLDFVVTNTIDDDML